MPHLLQRSNTALGWRRLARASGAGLVVLLLAAAVGFRDIEAGALCLGGVIAMLLFGYRSGGLGRFGLGLLCADVAAWMIPGAVSNLTHGESWVATALPSGLALAALTGLVGLLGSVIGDRMGRSAGRAPMIVAGVAVVVFVAANLAGAVAGGDDAAPVEPGQLSVTTENVRFAPDRLDVRSGAIGLTVTNLDLFWHTFTIRELNVDVRVPVQADRRITFTAAAGTYEFVCAIPGHTQAGMKGTLTVR